MDVQIEPDDTAAAIRDHLSNNSELLKDDYKNYLQHPLAGHCYVASEAYYRSLPAEEREALTPHSMALEWLEDSKVKSMTHWCLIDRGTNRVIDLTADQFDVTSTEPDYEWATGRGFVPPSPSERSQRVLEAI